MNPIQIGIIADYNSKNPYHVATNEALQHAADVLKISHQTRWLDTDKLDQPDAQSRMSECDALFGGPGSPYRSMEGALRAIRFAREQGYPFIGT